MNMNTYHPVYDHTDPMVINLDEMFWNIKVFFYKFTKLGRFRLAIENKRLEKLKKIYKEFQDSCEYTTPVRRLTRKLYLEGKIIVQESAIEFGDIYSHPWRLSHTKRGVVLKKGVPLWKDMLI